MKALIAASALLLCVSYASAGHDYYFAGNADTAVLIEGGSTAALGVVGYPNGINATGVSGYQVTAMYASVNQGSINYGLEAHANGVSDNYAVYGEASAGFYTNYAGYFDGDVTVTGTFSNPSDAKLKKDVHPLSTGLDAVLKLKPKDYEMRSDLKDFNFSKGRKFGLIAQDVETVLPNLVHQNKAPLRLSDEEKKNGTTRKATEYKSVDYLGLIPVLIKGMQEQQAQIQAQQNAISALQAELANLKGR